MDDSPIIRTAEPFDAFFRRVYGPLVGLATVLTGRRSVAEDIAQDALTAAYKSWERVARLDDPEAWVRRVVANQSVSLYRRSLVELRHALRQSSSAQGASNDDSKAESIEFWLKVRKSLSRQQAVALALRYVSGLTLREISEVMECSISSASTHLRRAHQRLATELASDWKEDW